MSCPFIKSCPAYASMKEGQERSHLAWAFCHTIYHDCGRYKRLIAGEAVPADMMPTGELATVKARKRTKTR